MKGNLRMLGILSLIFVALLVTLLVQQDGIDFMENRPTPQPTAILERVFPELELLRLQAVQLQVPVTGDSFTIARRGDGTWTAPGMDGELDTQAATLIARTVVLLPYRDSFSIDDAADLTQYGFIPEGGEFAILFITVDGEEHIVTIGYPNMNSPTFYALVDDRPEVYLIERPPLDFLVSYFREPPIIVDDTP